MQTEGYKFNYGEKTFLIHFPPVSDLYFTFETSGDMTLIVKEDEELYGFFEDMFFEIEKNKEHGNYFDKNELLVNNRLTWASEAGNSHINPGAASIMYVDKKDDSFLITFENRELELYGQNSFRNICVCFSGSRSQIFSTICGKLYHNMDKYINKKKLLKK